jgi:mRNA-degrading endonuclease toxin of MazEF toxin-antitoxin module
MVKGEIYFMDLAPRSGSEQMGRRPGIVVSNNAFSNNPRWRSVTIVPITSAKRWQMPSPTTVLFAKGEYNLPKACSALAHQVTTLDKGKIIAPAVARLTASKLADVETALRNYLLV